MPIVAGSKLVVQHPFTAEGEGELTVAQGTMLTVLESESEANAGWLLVKSQDGRSGYVPIDFLKEVDSPQPEVESSFKQKAASRMSVAMPPAALVEHRSMLDYGGASGEISSGGFPAAPQASVAWGAPAAVGSNAWVQRDALYGSLSRTPIPAQRRWYYRDIFGDMQGPFNAQEMKQRVDAKHIQPETFCIIEVGAGAAHKYEERKLRDLFPSMETAFMQAPILGGSKMYWFFLDDAKTEHGPFSADQMRLWFDVEGYFGANTPVREAKTGSPYVPLSQIFPDPMTCFLGGVGPADAPPPAIGAVPQDTSVFQVFDPFQASQQPPQRAQSSRSLLQAALAGGPPPAIGKGGVPPPPPPAAIGRQGSGKAQSMDEDEDDTLALFDKIDLMTAEERKKETSGGPAAKSVMRIYGNPDVWGPWKGVPNLQVRPDSFPTLLYHFFTRPLNPNAGKILCYITREIDGIGHFNYNKFILYLENETGPQPTAMAIRHYGPMSTSFDIKLLTNGRVEDAKGALTIAKMEVNFMGTQFLVHNSVPGHQGKAKDLCCILYEANRMGKGGPRKMKIGIPDIEENKAEFKTFTHGATGSESMLTSLQQINAKNLIPMLNKPPKWNEQKKAYSLDFGGRVTRASVKNFQLVDAIHDQAHTNVILQHGRVGQDKFTMDVQHPMSLLQAFAVCLSSLHQKKAVD